MSVWKGLGGRFEFFEPMLVKTDRIAARIQCPACAGACEIIEDGREYRGICQNTETLCEDLVFGSRDELLIYTLDQSRLWEKVARMLPIHRDVRELDNGAWRLGSGAALREETPKGVYGMLSDAGGVLRQALLMVAGLEERSILFLDCAAVDGGLGSLMGEEGKRMPVWDVVRFDGGESPAVRQIFGEPKPKALTEKEVQSRVRTRKGSLKDLGRDSADLRKMLGTMQTPAALWDWCTATYPYLPTEITRNPERYEGFIQSLSLEKIVLDPTQPLRPPGSQLPIESIEKVVKFLRQKMYPIFTAENIRSGAVVMAPALVSLAGGVHFLGRELSSQGFSRLGRLWLRAEIRQTNHWDQLYQQFFLDPLTRLAFAPEPVRREFFTKLTQNKIQYIGDGHFRKWRPMDRWVALWFYCGACIESGFGDVAEKLWAGGEKNGKPSWNHMMACLSKRAPELFETRSRKPPPILARPATVVKKVGDKRQPSIVNEEGVLEIRDRVAFEGVRYCPGPNAGFDGRTFEREGRKFLLPEKIEINGVHAV